jgi:hypothetical protein
MLLVMATVTTARETVEIAANAEAAVARVAVRVAVRAVEKAVVKAAVAVADVEPLLVDVEPLLAAADATIPEAPTWQMRPPSHLSKYF